MPRYHVGFWNVENLFAPENHPDREPWIADRVARELRGWTDALFQRKVAQLATAIAGMNGGNGPDLLGVCEVENAFVLEALANELNQRLGTRTYEVVHVDSRRDQRGIDTAFVFDRRRLGVDPAHVFSHFVIRRTGTRDITQATFTTAEGPELVALANHWPSRSGGAASTSAGFRATAGETLAYWHERIREVRGDDIAIIAMGDFNDEPWDPSVRLNANSTREEGDIRRSRSARLYNLAWRYVPQTLTDHRGDSRAVDGTLYYASDGNVFDQLLVNRSLLNGEGGITVLPDTAGIEALPAQVDHRAGQGPIRFGLPRGDAGANINLEGFSDHFPVTVVMETH